MSQRPIVHQPRFVVTGGAGFVGAYLVRKLLAQGETVGIIVKPSTGLWRIADLVANPRLIVVEGDLAKPGLVTEVLTKWQPEVVIHAATRGAYPSQTQIRDIFGSNVLAGLEVLTAAEAAGVKKCLVFGSSSEYGFSDQPMTEDQALRPASFYAVAKASVSYLIPLFAQRSSLQVTGLRLFSVYGPGEAPGRFLPQVLQAAAQGTHLKGANPQTARDFIYLDDVWLAVKRVLRRPRLSGQVLNLGTGVQTTLADAVRAAEVVTGRPIAVTWAAYPDRSWDTKYWVANMHHCRTELGWQPLTTLTKGLQKMWHWYETIGHSQYATISQKD